MTALRLGVLASTAAELGVSNVAGVLAMEQHILQLLILQIRTLQDILEIGLGKS